MKPGSSDSLYVMAQTGTAELTCEAVQLFLAILNLSPWLIAIVYDFVLWIYRCLWYEVGGGRARGETRPRAPSMRPNGRRLSFVELISGSPTRRRNTDDGLAELRQRRHRRDISHDSIVEDQEGD